MEQLTADALKIIKVMRAEYERKIKETEKEKNTKIEARARENEALENKILQMRKDFRLLNGVLAESKITAFEMWREILGFL